ncbi:MAG: radical SAM protein [Desulfobacterales bacterium]
MDKYRIDSHKLIYHPRRVSNWLSGENIYPIYMEVSPTSACNHRCVFCGLDFIGYGKYFLETGRLQETIGELGRLGVKSIMYAGEGEPFLHPDMVDIIRHTKDSGIDVAVTTNGVLMNRDISEKILGNTEWIKISCNAGNPETYSRIHRTRSRDFDMVMENLKQAVAIKKKNNYSCTIGMQILLLPENKKEIQQLAVAAKTIGLDYLVVKPYSQHPQSRTDKYRDIRYSDYFKLAEDLETLNTSDFSLLFRIQAMSRWDEQEKGYKKCLALPFWSYVDAKGNVWGCSVYLNDDRFYYGNIYEDAFQNIWESEKRRKSLAWVESKMDPVSCRVNCRMDEINRYLHKLKNPPIHVNYI